MMRSRGSAPGWVQGQLPWPSSLQTLIVLGVLVRLAFGAGIGLGVDESYMVVAGRGPLQLGYFDHPLVSWWLSRGAAWLFGSESAVAVRLPFILLFAVSTWLMARLGEAVATRRAGLWAALAFNLSPVFGVTAGGWVLPDGPLICALLGATLCLLRALPDGGWRWWLGAGLCLGAALLSKYTAVLTLAGFGLYVVASPVHRAWLWRAQPYVALASAALVFSPAIIWNAGNGWASIAFQGGRAAAAKLHLLGPMATLGGEALFLLPWIWAGLMLVFWRGLRGGDWRGRLLCALAAPPIVLFAVVSLWSRQVLFHWAAPGYLMLFPLLGAWLEGVAWAPRAARLTAGLLAVALIGIVVAVRLEMVALPGDPLLQIRTWSALRPALLGYHLPIAAISWADTGKAGIGLGPDIPIYCLSEDPRGFLFSTRPPDSGDLVIVAPRRSLAQMQMSYAGILTRIEALPPVRVGETDIPIYRGYGLIRWPQPPKPSPG